MSENEAVATCNKKEKTEDCVDECRGTKRRSQSQEENIYSANDWEHADLGDEGRKNKFLRLMGASKKEHHGKFVIGDKKPVVHHRTSEDTQRVNNELEEQFQQGIEMKLSGGPRRHIGLGYQDPETKDTIKDDAAVLPDDTLSVNSSLADLTELDSTTNKAEQNDRESRSAKEDKDSEKPAPIVGFVRGDTS